jgi:hypothetical protein
LSNTLERAREIERLDSVVRQKDGFEAACDLRYGFMLLQWTFGGNAAYPTIYATRFTRPASC